MIWQMGYEIASRLMKEARFIIDLKNRLGNKKNLFSYEGEFYKKASSSRLNWQHDRWYSPEDQ